MMGKLLSPSIHAVRKPLKQFLPVIQSARPDWPCTKMARPPMAEGGFGRNTAAPSASLRLVFALAATKTGTMGRKTRVVPSIRPFQQTTDFPLTGNACVLSVSMPCVQSVKDTTPALRRLDRNDYGCATAQARQTSIHWPTSPPWRLRWPPFCTALTPTVLPNSFGVPPDLSFPYLLQARGSPCCGFCALEMP